MLPTYAIRPDLARELIRELPELSIIRTQRILMVVDGSIQLAPSDGAFGIGKIAQIIDSADFGFARTRVVLATRDGAQNKFTLSEADRLTQATYTGFRFDQTEADGDRTIDQFDQIWCFGLKPIIHNPMPSDDAAIDNPANTPTTPSEGEALREWMDTRMGGMLAMGDHSILGASMCRGIPRVRRMRKWSVADGVPTREFSTRIDTNRPANAAQTYNPATNPFPAVMPDDGNQRDAVPQPIEWVPENSFVRGLFVYKQPHPILCHPTLGPINVMPDHAHEGLCYDTDEVTDPFGDFPTIDGNQPMPKTIAYGRTLADPPYNHQKGDQPARRFPLIAVYDGQEIGIGRVVVDSTWHHWFDLNISQLEAENGSEWQKIRRYFVNVAVWLAKPGWRSRMLDLHLTMVPFTYQYVQEFDLSMETRRLGVAFIDYLRPLLGPCWVTQLLIDIFDRLPLENALRDRLRPIPDPCLTCPPLALIEEYVYGQIGRMALKRAERLTERINQEGKLSLKELELESLEKEVMEAATIGLLELTNQYRESFKQTEALLERFERVAVQVKAAD